MLPRLPGFDPVRVDDLLDQHMKFNSGLTSDNLRRTLQLRLLQVAQAPVPAPVPKPAGERPAQKPSPQDKPAG